MNSYNRRVVAYMDIMGFSNLVLASQSHDEKFTLIHNAIQKLIQLKKENEIGKYSLNELLGIEISVFSDNILISYPVQEGALFELLMDIIHLQLDIMPYGILLRGGIAIDDAVHNGAECFGPAILEAVNLEQNKATFPRIIIDETTVENGISETYSSQNGIQKEAMYIYSLLRKDEDGVFFIDIFNQESELDWFGGEYYNWMARVRSVIIKGLNSNYNEPKILNKYIWLMNYYNKTVQDKAYIFVSSSVDSESKKYTDNFNSFYIKQINGVYC